MTHIILLDDGKLWAFEPPEKPQYCAGYCEGLRKCSHCQKALEAYNRAYSLALEQKIEVENVDDVQRWLNSRGIIFMAPNEPIKWEGPMTKILQVRHGVEWHDLPGKAGQERDGIYRTVVRLITPVKEENSAMSYTEGMRVESFQMEGSVHSPTFIKRKPVPSEQEKHYTERDIEIAYCIGLLNRMISMDELSEELKTSRDKIDRLKEAIKRGDFTPVNNNRP